MAPMYVYLMTNPGESVLYTGVTNDLMRRVYQHREKRLEGFTKRYNVTKLVYFEAFEDPESAIAREKQIKKWSRARKDALVESVNPGWRDLWDRLLDDPP